MNWKRFVTRIGRVYRMIWGPTTGEPFTYIMRRNPLSLLLPSLLLFAIIGFVWWRGIDHPLSLAAVMALLILDGVIIGHVFWGSGITRIEEERQP